MSALTHSAYDVAIIGAGPAGLAAAAMTAKAGLSTLLLDENAGPGGQVWRALDATPLRRRDILGEDYWAGEALVKEARQSGAEIVASATVWALDHNLELAVSIGGASSFVKARRVIVATGALERPFPIPGWTLPGVMTAGAAQTLLKTSGMIPAGRIVIAGQGPLLWLLAAQLLRAGAKIDLVLDTAERGAWRKAAAHMLAFAVSPYFAKGLALLREVKTKTKVVSGVVDLVAEGDGRVERLTYEAGGRRVTIAVDTLLLHHGVVPNINLAMAAGVKHVWDARQYCWRPELDADFGSSLTGLAIAGDGAGIGGALAAVARGRIAARAAIEALAPQAAGGLDGMALLRADLARAERGRAFLDIMFRPSAHFRIPRGDTLVCRCEEVSARDVLEAVAIGATGPNQLKAYRRAGMGPCQGRLCGLTVTELMAEARGVGPEEIGYYRLRPPVKPITLGELASAPASETEARSVAED
jgi:thioredoxin reductase/bacterioferritin-associated ferredoxin